MKLYDVSWVAIIAVLLSCFVAAESIKYLGEDNFIEEGEEWFIEQETGLDIDITPASKEVPSKSSERLKRWQEKNLSKR